MRKIQFANKEFYHIFNRGNDKRIIFIDRYDMERFFQSMQEFNTIEPIGSIFANHFKNQQNNHIAHSHLEAGLPNKPSFQVNTQQDKLVNFICYCLNPNHYHFILEQCVDKGVEKFMHRIGTGYSKFFNKKYKRIGTLFEGNYKALHIDSNEYLLHLSAYVNLNNKAHQLKNTDYKSSWLEYSDEKHDQKFCAKNIVLDQFKTRAEYKQFAEKSLVDILEKKKLQQGMLLE